jgi:hypothetical protein
MLGMGPRQLRVNLSAFLFTALLVLVSGVLGESGSSSSSLHGAPPALPAVNATGVDLSISFIYNKFSANGSARFHYSHMSTIEQIGNGTYMAAWQTSHVGEGHLDQHIRFTVSHDNGTTWSEPASAIPYTDIPLWGPALFYNPKIKRMFLYYSQSVSVNCNITRSRCAPGGRLLFSYSDDLGAHWAEGVELVGFFSKERGDIAKVTANKPILTSSNYSSWVIPFWQQAEQGTSIVARNTTGPPCGGVLITEDGGQTYKPYGFVHSVNYTFYTIEPSGINLGSLDSKRVMQYYRTENIGILYESVSEDAGKTWSPIQPTMLPNPDSKAYAAARIDPSTGNVEEVVLCLNPTYPWTNHGRHILTVVKSSNPALLGTSSHTWEPFAVILDDPTGDDFGSYPTVMPDALDRQRWLVSYTCPEGICLASINEPAGSNPTSTPAPSYSINMKSVGIGLGCVGAALVGVIAMALFCKNKNSVPVDADEDIVSPTQEKQPLNR